jgi:hypothetical protein
MRRRIVLLRERLFLSIVVFFWMSWGVSPRGLGNWWHLEYHCGWQSLEAKVLMRLGLRQFRQAWVDVSSMDWHGDSFRSVASIET